MKFLWEKTFRAAEDGGASGAASGDGGKAPASASGASASASVDSDWINSLSPENQQLALAKGFLKPDDFATSYRNLEGLVGGKTLELPNMAKPEGLAEWAGWEALGVPSDPAGYELKKPDLPEGMGWDDRFEKQAREAAAMLKLTPFQFQGMVDIFAAREGASVAAVNAERKAAEKEVDAQLQKEWGSEKAGRIEMAKSAVRHYQQGGALDAGQIDKLNLMMGDVGLVKFMADIGSQLSEAKLITGVTPGLSLTSTAAKAEKARLRSDSGFMRSFQDRSDPNHKEAVARMTRLTAVENGEGGH